MLSREAPVTALNGNHGARAMPAGLAARRFALFNPSVASKQGLPWNKGIGVSRRASAWMESNTKAINRLARFLVYFGKRRNVSNVFSVN